MKRWSLGTYHGLRRKHVDTYLNEFVFRYNRRFYRHVSFETLLGLAANKEPASYWDLIKRDNRSKSAGDPPPQHIDEPSQRDKPPLKSSCILTSTFGRVSSRRSASRYAPNSSETQEMNSLTPWSATDFRRRNSICGITLRQFGAFR